MILKLNIRPVFYLLVIALAIRYGTAVKPAEVILALVVGLWFLRGAITDKIVMPRTVLDPLNAALLCVGWASLLATVNIRVALVEYARLIFCVLLFYITVHFSSDRKTFKRVLLLLMMSTGLVGIAGLYPIAIYIQTRTFPARSSVLNRLSMTFNDPNYYGAFAAVGLLIGLGYLLWQPQQRPRNRLIVFTYCIVQGINVLFTMSRSAWIMTILGFGLIMVITDRTKRQLCQIFTLLLICIGLLGIGYFVLQSTAPFFIHSLLRRGSLQVILGQQDQQRFDLWRGALSMIADKPLGVGLANHLYNYAPYAYAMDTLVQVPHNVYLQVGSELGVHGLLTWSVLQTVSFIELSKVRIQHQDTELGAWKKILWLISIAFLIEGLALNTLTLRHMWFSMGLGIALKNIAARARRT